MTALPPRVGRDVSIRFRLTETGPVIETEAQVVWRSNGFRGRGGLMGVLLLPALAAFLLLAWERLTGLGADERREIGVLKSVGWGTADVLTARLWESAAIGVLGATLGLLVAYGYVFWLGAPGLADALLGWSALHPSMRLAPALDPVQALALLGAVVVPFVSVSVVPAWRAAMVDPDQAMRGAG